MPDGNMNLLEACTINLEYWKKQKAFLDAIVFQQMGALLRDRIVLYFTKDETVLYALLDTPDVNTDLDIISTYVAIRISLLFRWHSRNFDTAAEDMARKYVRMIQSPLLPADAAVVSEIVQSLFNC